MLSYQSRTYCISPNCTCGRALTAEIIQAARKWWGAPNPPISVAYLCQKGNKNEEPNNSND